MTKGRRRRRGWLEAGEKRGKTIGARQRRQWVVGETLLSSKVLINEPLRDASDSLIRDEFCPAVRFFPAIAAVFNSAFGRASPVWPRLVAGFAIPGFIRRTRSAADSNIGTVQDTARFIDDLQHVIEHPVTAFGPPFPLQCLAYPLLHLGIGCGSLAHWLGFGRPAIPVAQSGCWRSVVGRVREPVSKSRATRSVRHASGEAQTS